ncbi:MAG: hypothetical protein L3J46_00530 [Kangiellaceae bacterium]|nr:hypothetical protein [Kangiellaceae bacterium]
MFVGHYTAALILKSVEPKASLGWLFVAVQFVDILFFPFVYFGIERFNIVDHFTESTHFQLEYMPYTHGLVGSIGWAIFTYLVFHFIIKKVNKISIIMAFAVLSHWFLDLIMHTPDLPLLGNDSVKFGFGLWNNANLTFTIEAMLLGVGLWMYLKSTKAISMLGKYAMIIFVILMVFMNTINVYGPPPASKLEVIISAMLSYIVLAAIAFWLDRKRT